MLIPCVPTLPVLIFMFPLAEMTHLCRVIVTSAKGKISKRGVDKQDCKNGSLLLASFGNALIKASEFKAVRSTNNKPNLLGVLNQTWKTIMSISNIDHYLR